MSETWLINDTPKLAPATGKVTNYHANFKTNNKEYTIFIVEWADDPDHEKDAILTYTTTTGPNTHAYNPLNGGWTNENYKTLEFTGTIPEDLLTWLQANGTKQATPTTKQQIDLSTLSGWANLSDGTHTITIVAKGTGYRDSEKSAGVEVVKGTQVYTDCLTFTGKTSEFTLKASSKTWDGTLEWSTDHNTWTTLAGTEAMQSVDKKLYLRGKGNTTFKAFVSWKLSEKADCTGNIQTLLDWENPPTSISTKDCYAYMFSDCKNLTSAPELPATMLTEHCYDGMFSGCSNLTSAPELPATTLTDGCYSNMFYKCLKLKVNTTSGNKIFK